MSDRVLGELVLYGEGGAEVQVRACVSPLRGDEVVLVGWCKSGGRVYVAMQNPAIGREKFDRGRDVFMRSFAEAVAMSADACISGG